MQDRGKKKKKQRTPWGCHLSITSPGPRSQSLKYWFEWGKCWNLTGFFALRCSVICSWWRQETREEMGAEGGGVPSESGMPLSGMGGKKMLFLLEHCDPHAILRQWPASRASAEAAGQHGRARTNKLADSGEEVTSLSSEAKERAAQGTRGQRDR